MKLQLLHTYILATISLVLTYKETSLPDDLCVIQPDSIAIAPTLLTLSYTEKIMGEPAELTCNTFIRKEDILEYKCDYTATSQDEITGKTGKLYYVRNMPVLHKGVEIVTGLGDESYYHSDGMNFYFLPGKRK